MLLRLAGGMICSGGGFTRLRLLNIVRHTSRRRVSVSCVLVDDRGTKSVLYGWSKPCTSKAIVAIAPAMINIRRKSCIIIFSVVLTPLATTANIYSLRVFAVRQNAGCTVGFRSIR